MRTRTCVRSYKRVVFCEKGGFMFLVNAKNIDTCQPKQSSQSCLCDKYKLRKEVFALWIYRCVQDKELGGESLGRTN